MSKIKFNQDFKDLEGEVLYGKKECCVQNAKGELIKENGNLLIAIIPTPEDKLELKQVCIKALLTDAQDDTPDHKAKKYILFQKFQNSNGEIELSSEETTLVKDQIAKTQPTLIMGQAHDMLEGK